MNTIENIDTKSLVYTFTLHNETYRIGHSEHAPELPVNVQSFAIITNTDERANNSVFDSLIDGWKEFYEALMIQEGEMYSGYLIRNITVQEAAELAEKSDSNHFAYWNSNKFNIFPTENIELIDVWSF